MEYKELKNLKPGDNIVCNMVCLTVHDVVNDKIVVHIDDYILWKKVQNTVMSELELSHLIHEEAKKASHTLHEQLKSKPWYLTIGIGEDRGKPKLIIYTKSKDHPVDILKFKDFPVSYTYIGEIELL